MSDSKPGGSIEKGRPKRMRRLAVVPNYVLVFAVGWGFGMTWRLPFFPWMLGEAASTVLGAAAGALVGVAGAAVIAVNIANRTDRKGREDVLEILERVMTAIQTASCVCDGKKRVVKDIYGIYGRLSNPVTICLSRLKFLETSTRHVQAAGLAICDASVAVGRFQERLKKEMGAVLELARGAGAVGHNGEQTPYTVSKSFEESLNGITKMLSVIADRLDRGIQLEPRRSRAKADVHHEGETQS